MTVMITGRALLATILVPVDLTKLTHISNTGPLHLPKPLLHCCCCAGADSEFPGWLHYLRPVLV